MVKASVVTRSLVIAIVIAAGPAASNYVGLEKILHEACQCLGKTIYTADLEVFSQLKRRQLSKK